MHITLSEIEKSFDDNKVLDGINITIEHGEFVTLVGASGCGKSTLLRILAGLESADSGHISVAGKDMTQVRPADRNLAMVFQSYALYPHLSVAENIATPLRLRDLPWHAKIPLVGPLFNRSRYRELQRQVHDAADVLKINHLLDRKPGQLSGGQRQRVALGRALVRNPEAFLMDEPLSNLDAALRVHMRSELSELHRRLGTTFIYVTHYQSEALTMSDRMAVMDRGRILQYGAPDEIYHKPQNIEVAKFIGSPPINILRGEVREQNKLVLLGELIGRISPDNSTVQIGTVQIGCRAEDVMIEGTGVQAIVTHRENLGSEVFLHTKLAQTEEKIIVRAPSGARERVQDRIRLQLNPKKLHAFNGEGSRVEVHHDIAQSGATTDAPDSILYNPPGSPDNNAHQRATH